MRRSDFRDVHRRQYAGAAEATPAVIRTAMKNAAELAAPVATAVIRNKIAFRASLADAQENQRVCLRQKRQLRSEQH